MTRSQHALEIQQERLAEQTRDGFGGNSPASVRKNPGDEPWGSDHAINIRLSIPLLFTHCYVTIVAGTERRDRKRRASERRKHPLATAGNIAVLSALGTLLGLAGLALVQLASAYILKETGIMVVPQ